MTLLDLNYQVQCLISYRHLTNTKHSYGMDPAEPSGAGERTYCIRHVTAVGCRVQLKCYGTRLRTGEEVKGKLAN